MNYPKVPQEINNIADDNVKLLAQLFPSVVKDGQIDFEALKEELGQFEEVGKEKYELTWAGKQDAKKKAQEDAYNRTLKYIEADSKNPDTTENLYIEGDNLEVLKLLRQNYYGAIKMIYIDPPYNTDGDFVYNDKFKMSAEENDILEGARDESGNALQKNSKSSNRYHANWLNMMYPRLKVAKDLLADDGAIFIHIDENEVYNMQVIVRDVFGESNELGTIIWDKRNPKGVSVGVAYQHESIIVFCKNKVSFANIEFTKSKENAETMINKVNALIKKYNGVNDDVRREYKLWLKEHDSELSGGERAYRFIDDTGRIYQPVSMAAPDKPETRSHRPLIHPTTGKPCPTPEKGWRFTDKAMDQLIGLDKIEFGKNETTQPRQRYYLDENLEESFSSLMYFGGSDEAMGLQFDNPKPVVLADKIIKSICKGSNDIIIDFFSGSATTAHSVMNLNSSDDGKRKFIMVQLPEKVEEKSNAYKLLIDLDKPTNICEIGKERIRRAGEKIKQEIETANTQLKLGEEPKQVPDIGFKVFRTADTNIKWNLYDALEQIDTDTMAHTPDLADFTIGANDIDVVYEVMLRQKDAPLSSTLETLTDIGSRTYLYGSAYLVCLEIEITEVLIDKLAALDPLPIKFVFRDSAFKDDINLKDETFRRLKNLIERNSGLAKKSYTVEFI
ncbi:site-specific DNA-methyltransferase [Clostridium algidicarnis]|uniref:site-specific DNA-methyltransferase n=1 Tax=Clostridium algidicarnis TaxID=37659 RepID=UPI00162350D3|nr:site-specific DNA-methyltransferase [Clostridium algidicarnis]MBB6630645.1 site-specific DNA-methyltransferase [Clostridium algidicarnis]